MATSRLLLLGLSAITLMSAIALPQKAVAQGYAAMSCGQLWYERNAIYAQFGYCFQSQQAISTFGPGCRPPYGKLSVSAQNRVNQIVSWERNKGCS